MKPLFVLVTLLCVFGYQAIGAVTQPRKTTVSIVGEDFHINGQPSYAGRSWKGHRIEGLLLNTRMVQGVFDDLNPETAKRWHYPDTSKWDSERNVREFIAAMPEWKRHGLLAFTVNFQGGSPEGYSSKQTWETGAFTPEGALRPEFASRMRRVLDAADDLGMVVIVGYFYFGQSPRLAGDEAAIRATDESTRWLLEGGWRNVLVEINNETNPTYEPPILRPDRVSELIRRVKVMKAADGHSLLVGTSFGGCVVPTSKVVAASDFLLIHGNGASKPEAITDLIRKTRALPTYRAMPVVNNEDDHENFDQPENNLTASLREHVSWGWFDYRRKGESWDDGYQSPPVNWGISSERKRAFFKLCAEITGYEKPALVLSLDPLAGSPGIFAREEIRRAASARGMTIASAEDEAKPPANAMHIVLAVDASAGTNRPPQSYRIRARHENGHYTLSVLGADTAGVLYGGLDVAEAIRTGTLDSLKDSDHTPHIAQRGIKFNIPLDLRTPSYSDNSHSAQANIPEMWSVEFWREFLDEMARNRFNVLSLWSLNPFPSIVKVPEYPDVALNNVLRGRPECFDENFPLDGRNMFKAQFLKDAEVVKRMTIEEKIEFWRRVMRMAKDRGVEVYWFTWNTFLHSEEGKHGLSRSKPDANLVRYFRASVRETVKTYPLLAGMGITAGEYMGEGLGGLSREQWLWQTYGEGIRDALKDQPGRKFRMIHRFHMTGLDEVTAQWKDYPGPFDFSYKYAVAHMYGMTNPPFINPLLPELSPTRRTWLTVRNDDIYSFRWGDPQFARDFIRAMPGPDKVAGFYMGPDGYCWGREAMDLEPESPRQLIMQKQWFSFMLWGRLSYDPTLSDELFRRTLAARFPEVPPDKLLAGWSAASRIIPEVTRFFWGNIDLKWLPEACLSHPTHKGFYTVRHFVEGEGMPGSGDLNTREWRERLQAKQPMDGATPLEVAAHLRRHAEAAKRTVAELRPQQGTNKELRLTLGDIEAFACLGFYYAAKIEGACELALFDANSKAEHQASAIQHLEAALGHWRDYAATYTKQYQQPLLYNRVGIVNIPKLAEKVAEDMEIARTWKPGSIGKAPPRKAGGSKYGQ